MTQFALSWDAHMKNICNGLSYLQQVSLEFILGMDVFNGNTNNAIYIYLDFFDLI